MPFIGLKFIKEYLIPNYIGESLAALITAVLSLLQGLGQDSGCYNVTNPATNRTQLTPIDIKPKYSVSVYFLLMACLLGISTFSFTMLNYTKCALAERNKKKMSKSGEILEISNNGSSSESSSALSGGGGRLTLPRLSDTKEKLILWTYIFFISFIFFGFLPSFQSYFTLPYSK
jgi:hypothetical protein